MELRLLTTESERRIFAERQAEARAMHGAGFKETSRSQLAKIHLAFGNLYALFEKEGDPPEKMIAGLAMHDLEMFPQSHPKPDLSHLPPRSVLECSDLWSLCKGAGMRAWCGAAVPARVQGAAAVLVYLAVRPFDNTAFYTATGFGKAGEPFEYPYLETLDGRKIWAQAMVLEGEALKQAISALSALCVETLDNYRIVRLSDSLALSPFPAPLASPSSEGAATLLTPAHEGRAAGVRKTAGL